MSSLGNISTRGHKIDTLYFVALLRKELGSRIKEARDAAQLTQRELADRIHLKTASDVSRYERGTVDVPSHRIDLIAEATGRPRSFFTRDPDEPETLTQGEVEQLRAQLDQLLSLVQEIRQEMAEQREPPQVRLAASPRARRGGPS